MQCQSVLVVGHPQCSEEREEEHSVTTRVHSPHGAQAIPDVPKQMPAAVDGVVAEGPGNDELAPQQHHAREGLCSGVQLLEGCLLYTSPSPRDS